MILDDSLGFLYIADTGNQRILKFNVNSGNYSYDLTPYGESLSEYYMMENAEWEVYISQELEKPSGIDIYDDRLVISDYASGHIIIYDISTTPPYELGRIDTGSENNIMGIKIDNNQKIWYVSYNDNNVVRIDYNIIHGDINSDGSVNVLDVVVLVNFILNFEDIEFPFADINDDGDVNIIDIVQLVALILN